MKKAANQWCYPGGMALEALFLAARTAGMDGVELNLYEPGETGLTLATTDVQARAVKVMANDAGIDLPSLSCGLLWKWPLSSPDLSVRQKASEIVRKQIALAAVMGMGVVLVVPGIVDAATSYEDCYQRSLDEIANLASFASDHGITIGIENVWNRFLLSPMELLRYLQAVDSPHVQAYFDVGNVLQFGYPEQWIRSLGSHIVKVHVKDFSLQVGNIHGFVPLLAGDVNWPAVMQALHGIGYDDYLTAEVSPYAQDVAGAVRDASGALDVLLSLVPQ